MNQSTKVTKNLRAVVVKHSLLVLLVGLFLQGSFTEALIDGSTASNLDLPTTFFNLQGPFAPVVTVVNSRFAGVNVTSSIDDVLFRLINITLVNQGFQVLSASLRNVVIQLENVNIAATMADAQILYFTGGSVLNVTLSMRNLTLSATRPASDHQFEVVRVIAFEATTISNCSIQLEEVSIIVQLPTDEKMLRLVDFAAAADVAGPARNVSGFYLRLRNVSAAVTLTGNADFLRFFGSSTQPNVISNSMIDLTHVTTTFNATTGTTGPLVGAVQVLTFGASKHLVQTSQNWTLEIDSRKASVLHWENDTTAATHAVVDTRMTIRTTSAKASLFVTTGLRVVNMNVSAVDSHFIVGSTHHDTEAFQYSSGTQSSVTLTRSTLKLHPDTKIHGNLATVSFVSFARTDGFLVSILDESTISVASAGEFRLFDSRDVSSAHNVNILVASRSVINISASSAYVLCASDAQNISIAFQDAAVLQIDTTSSGAVYVMQWTQKVSNVTVSLLSSAFLFPAGGAELHFISAQCDTVSLLHVHASHSFFVMSSDRFRSTVYQTVPNIHAFYLQGDTTLSPGQPKTVNVQMRLENVTLDVFENRGGVALLGVKKSVANASFIVTRQSTLSIVIRNGYLTLMSLGGAEGIYDTIQSSYALGSYTRDQITFSIDGNSTVNATEIVTSVASLSNTFYHLLLSSNWGHVSNLNATVHESLVLFNPHYTSARSHAALGSILGACLDNCSVGIVSSTVNHTSGFLKEFWILATTSPTPFSGEMSFHLLNSNLSVHTKYTEVIALTSDQPSAAVRQHQHLTMALQKSTIDIQYAESVNLCSVGNYTTRVSVITKGLSLTLFHPSDVDITSRAFSWMRFRNATSALTVALDAINATVRDYYQIRILSVERPDADTEDESSFSMTADINGAFSTTHFTMYTSYAGLFHWCRFEVALRDSTIAIMPGRMTAESGHNTEVWYFKRSLWNTTIRVGTKDEVTDPPTTWQVDLRYLQYLHQCFCFEGAELINVDLTVHPGALVAVTIATEHLQSFTVRPTLRIVNASFHYHNLDLSAIFDYYNTNTRLTQFAVRLGATIKEAFGITQFIDCGNTRTGPYVSSLNRVTLQWGSLLAISSEDSSALSSISSVNITARNCVLDKLKLGYRALSASTTLSAEDLLDSINAIGSVVLSEVPALFSTQGVIAVAQGALTLNHITLRMDGVRTVALGPTEVDWYAPPTRPLLYGVIASSGLVQQVELCAVGGYIAAYLPTIAFGREVSALYLPQLNEIQANKTHAYDVRQVQLSNPHVTTRFLHATASGPWAIQFQPMFHVKMFCVMGRLSDATFEFDGFHGIVGLLNSHPPFPGRGQFSYNTSIFELVHLDATWYNNTSSLKSSSLSANATATHSNITITISDLWIEHNLTPLGSNFVHFLSLSSGSAIHGVNIVLQKASDAFALFRLTAHIFCSILNVQADVEVRDVAITLNATDRLTSTVSLAVALRAYGPRRNGDVAPLSVPTQAEATDYNNWAYTASNPERWRGVEMLTFGPPRAFQSTELQQQTSSVLLLATTTHISNVSVFVDGIVPASTFLSDEGQTYHINRILTTNANGLSISPFSGSSTGNGSPPRRTLTLENASFSISPAAGGMTGQAVELTSFLHLRGNLRDVRIELAIDNNRNESAPNQTAAQMSFEVEYGNVFVMSHGPAALSRGEMNATHSTSADESMLGVSFLLRNVNPSSVTTTSTIRIVNTTTTAPLLLNSSASLYVLWLGATGSIINSQVVASTIHPFLGISNLALSGSLYVLSANAAMASNEGVTRKAISFALVGIKSQAEADGSSQLPPLRRNNFAAIATGSVFFMVICGGSSSVQGTALSMRVEHISQMILQSLNEAVGMVAGSDPFLLFAVTTLPAVPRMGLDKFTLSLERIVQLQVSAATQTVFGDFNNATDVRIRCALVAVKLISKSNAVRALSFDARSNTTNVQINVTASTFQIVAVSSTSFLAWRPSTTEPLDNQEAAIQNLSVDIDQSEVTLSTLESSATDSEVRVLHFPSSSPASNDTRSSRLLGLRSVSNVSINIQSSTVVAAASESVTARCSMLTFLVDDDDEDGAPTTATNVNAPFCFGCFVIIRNSTVGAAVQEVNGRSNVTVDVLRFHGANAPPPSTSPSSTTVTSIEHLREIDASIVKTGSSALDASSTSLLGKWFSIGITIVNSTVIASNIGQVNEAVETSAWSNVVRAVTFSGGPLSLPTFIHVAGPTAYLWSVGGGVTSELLHFGSPAQNLLIHVSDGALLQVIPQQLRRWSQAPNDARSSILYFPEALSHSVVIFEKGASVKLIGGSISQMFAIDKDCNDTFASFSDVSVVNNASFQSKSFVSTNWVTVRVNNTLVVERCAITSVSTGIRDAAAYAAVTAISGQPGLNNQTIFVRDCTIAIEGITVFALHLYGVFDVYGGSIIFDRNSIYTKRFSVDPSMWTLEVFWYAATVLIAGPSEQEKANGGTVILRHFGPATYDVTRNTFIGGRFLLGFSNSSSSAPPGRLLVTQLAPPANTSYSISFNSIIATTQVAVNAIDLLGTASSVSETPSKNSAVRVHCNHMSFAGDAAFNINAEALAKTTTVNGRGPLVRALFKRAFPFPAADLDECRTRTVTSTQSRYSHTNTATSSGSGTATQTHSGSQRSRSRSLDSNSMSDSTSFSDSRTLSKGSFTKTVTASATGASRTESNATLSFSVNFSSSEALDGGTPSLSNSYSDPFSAPSLEMVVHDQSLGWAEDSQQLTRPLLLRIQSPFPGVVPMPTVDVFSRSSNLDAFEEQKRTKNNALTQRWLTSDPDSICCYGFSSTTASAKQQNATTPTTRRQRRDGALAHFRALRNLSSSLDVSQQPVDAWMAAIDVNATLIAGSNNSLLALIIFGSNVPLLRSPQNISVWLTRGCFERRSLPINDGEASFVVLPPPSRPTERLSTGSQVTGSASAALSASSGSVGGAAIVARTNALASLATCDNDAGGQQYEKEDPDRSNSPTKGEIGNESVSYMLGALIYNQILLVACALPCVVAAAVWRYLRMRSGKPTLWSTAFGWARFPSLLVFPLMFLFQPTITAASICILYGGVLPQVMGLFLVPTVGVFLVALFKLLRGRHFAVEWVPNPREAFGLTDTKDGDGDDVNFKTPFTGGKWDKAGLVALFNVLTYEYGEWRDKDNAQQHPTFSKRFFLLFADYNTRCSWFIVFEFVISALLGFADALTSAAGCSAMSTLSLLLLVVYLGTILYVRPHSSRFNYLFTVLLAALQVIAAVLTIFYFYVSAKSKKLQLGIIILLDLVLYITAVRAVYDVSRLVWQLMRYRVKKFQEAQKRKKKRRHALDNNDRMDRGLLMMEDSDSRFQDEEWLSSGGSSSKDLRNEDDEETTTTAVLVAPEATTKEPLSDRGGAHQKQAVPTRSQRRSARAERRRAATLSMLHQQEEEFEQLLEAIQQVHATLNQSRNMRHTVDQQDLL